MEWMTIKEAGLLWGITTRRAQILCANGQVKDAQKLGNIWVVPKGTAKPADGRTKAARTVGDEKSRHYEGGLTYEKE